MGKILGFVSIKGGVGKTTLALETASSLANDFGRRVLLVDANFSAPNLSFYLGIEPELTLHDVLSDTTKFGVHNAVYERHGFDIVPAALIYKREVDVFKLKNILSKIKDKYDFVILDSSPNYYELVPVVVASDKLFIVTTPDFPTLNTSFKAARLARKNKTPVEGIIINKIRNPKYEASLKDIEEGLEIPVVARILDNKGMSEALFYNTPMTLHKERDVFSKEVRRFASALCGLPEANPGFLERLIPFQNRMRKEKVNRELMRQKFYEEQFN